MSHYFCPFFRQLDVTFQHEDNLSHVVHSFWKLKKSLFSSCLPIYETLSVIEPLLGILDHQPVHVLRNILKLHSFCGGMGHSTQ